jgi:hypothetical protein
MRTTTISVRCRPAHIHQVGAGRLLKGVQALVHLRYAFPSCLPDPVRLVVPARPVVVRAASRPPLCFQDQAALSFIALLRQADGGSFQPTRLHGASWRTRARSDSRRSSTVPASD